jgi:hypothetical protein
MARRKRSYIPKAHQLCTHDRKGWTAVDGHAALAVRLGASSGASGSVTYLIGERTGTQITDRQLEPPGAAGDADLQGDQRVRVRSRSRRRHGGRREVVGACVSCEAER